MAQCTAKSKRSGEQCKKDAMKEKNVCYFHGGKSLSGVAHPNYKTGRYAKGLKGRKAKIIDRLLSDEDLLSLDDNIALLDLRIVTLVDSLMEEGNPAELWKAAVKSWNYLDRAIDRIDADGIDRHTKELGTILEKGIREIATWDEIQDRTEARRKLTDSEVMRREKMQYMVLVEDMLKDYMAMGRIIKLAVLDQDDITKEIKVQLLKRIQSGLARQMQIDVASGTEAD